MQARQAGPRRLLALAGQGDSGRDDVASDVKRHLAQALDAKLGQAPGGAAPPRP
jgi:hypothetical protein